MTSVASCGINLILQRFAGEEATQIICKQGSDCPRVTGTVPACVLPEDDIRHLPEDVVGIRGVRGFNAVETGATQSSRGEGLAECGSFNQGTATDVVNMCAIANARNPGRVDHMPCLWGQGQAKGDMVGQWQHFIKLVQSNNAVASGHLARVALDTNDVHAQCLGTDCHAPTDVSKTDHEEGLTGELPLRGCDFARNGPPLNLGTNEDVKSG